jgi:hypothetical protein
MEQAEHYVDVDCIEVGDFRTFYMTCSCGWLSELKYFNNSFDSYYLQEKWRQHREPTTEFKRQQI